MKHSCLAAVFAALLATTGFTGTAEAAPAAEQAAPQRQPIPLSLSRVERNLGKPGVYVFDCNPENIYEQSHLKGSIHANVENWTDLLPEDKKNSFIILYCINRLCNVSYEASLKVIELGYENVYLMPDGIQGWVSNGYEFEGKGRKDYSLEAARAARQ
ncbi:rhodanese-like domain-containing protein [Sutterella sp.]|uniref:rhodanese-like domain-containing protein n=1 Tax=Sutterella sp. TaxID=1981025 RepID=UPI0026DFBC9F|nr:rhodanese-like domain-containing protein [Sutterella sp.]MDO5531377.1 rhodanese-like domain-containing protein [Sutterella sp.]